MNAQPTRPAADNAASLNERFCRALVQGLADAGLTDAVLSPGSRNTPLVMALAEAAGIETHVVLDERSAGFVGLGLARVQGRAAALVCTSGSAGAHYLPAVLEAERSRLPLLVVTADRPLELQGCGAPQTVEQQLLFGRHVTWSRSLEPFPSFEPAWLAQVAAQAMSRAAGRPAGPVHLNLAFRKPLWQGTSAPDLASQPAAPEVLRPELRPDQALLTRVARQLAGHAKGLIVCGPRAWGSVPGREPEFARAVAHLGRRLGWPVLADGVSGVRSGTHDKQGLVISADALLRQPDFARQHAPECVLQFGQIPTSSAVQAWLAQGPARTQVVVDPHGDWHDPARRVTTLVEADPTALATALADVLPGPLAEGDQWRLSWQRAEAAAGLALEAACGEGLWEAPLARLAFETMPAGGLLHVAASMPVRDLDGFGGALARPVHVTSNRGTNGIDGTLSTALGQALAWERGPVRLLTGDLAFLHDLGGLVASRNLGVSLEVVVANNGGGAIFGYLPIAGQVDPQTFQRHFLTPQDADLAGLCQALGAEHVRVEDRAGLEQVLGQASARRGLRVVEVLIDREENHRRHEQAWAQVGQALLSQAGSSEAVDEEVVTR